MNRKCRGQRQDGERCQAWSMKVSDYCHAHHTKMLSDVELEKSDSYLFSSRIVKILSFRDEEILIAKRLKILKTLDVARFRKLGGICDRLDFKERFRHTSRLLAKEGVEQYIIYQRDRLNAYLTATCIDVAAGQNDFQQFFDWLRSELKSDKTRASTESLVNSLALAKSESEVVKQLARGMNAHRLDSTAYEYLEEQGVRRGFKRALNSLDDWLKEWLTEVYFIVGDFILRPGIANSWLELNDVQKYARVVDYLYQLRNTYTHTVSYRPTMEDVWGSFTTSINGVRYRFRSIDNGDSTMSEIGLREDLSETDVIELLVVLYLRTKIVLLNDDQSFLGRYMERLHYRRLRYRFLFELQQNLKLVQAWCSNHLFFKSHSKRPLSRISTLVAKEFLETHKALGGWRLSILTDSQSYLRSAEQLNARIDSFNEHGVLEDHGDIDKILASFCTMQETAHLVWFIQDSTFNLIENEPHF